jgi:flagellar hook-associated protein 2
VSTTSIFSGNSRFSTDFTQIIERSLRIASLPLTQLAQQQSALSQRQAAYAAIEGRMAAVSQAVDSVANALGAASYEAQASSTTVATASASAGAFAGSYEIQVLNAGSFERAMSANGWNTVTNPATQNLVADLSFTLSVDGADTAITLTSSSLTELASAINQSGAAVQATIINIGSTSSPDYRLSLQSKGVGNIPIQLTGSVSGDLMNTLATGSEALYTVNGQPPGGIASRSRTVTIAPGVTANLLATGTSTVTVRRTTAALAGAISSLVAAYNATVGELDQHRGQGTGVLKGDSTIWQLASKLRSIVNYEPASGSIRSLGALGIAFQQSGRLTFNAGALDAANIEDLQAFFGNATSGFVGAARKAVNEITSPTGGTLPAVIGSISSQITQASSRIAAEQNRIDLLEDSLNSQMARADALIAGLEQQANYFSNLFTSMRESQRR